MINHSINSSKYCLISLRRCYSINSASVKQIGPGGFALLSVPVVTFCLGTWQVKRLSWKQNLIAETTKRMNSPPVELPDDLNKLSKMEYQRVIVRGKFDHSKEMYIGMRQLVEPENRGGGIFSSRPKMGSFVVTPFRISGKDDTILVNRGWIPRNRVDPSTRKEGQIEDEIELIGTVRLPEKRPQFSPKHQLGSRIFYYRDVPLMAELSNSDPIFLDAGPENDVPGGPVGGQTRITFRNDHFSYLLTWYSLSIATSYMWYRKYIYGLRVSV